MKHASAVIFMLFAFLSGVKEIAAQMDWATNTPPDRAYSATYKLTRISGVCYVNVLADGSGVMLIASRTTRENRMMQQIQVGENGAKSLTYSAVYQLMKWNGTEFVAPNIATLIARRKNREYIKNVVILPGPYEEDPFVPDLFKENCLEHTKDLPSEVRRLFFGYDKVQ